MYPLIRSARLYFWPIIAANTVAMTIVVGGDALRAAELSIAISCLASFGFLLNDLWDIDVDRINNVHQAKPFTYSSGSVRRSGAVLSLAFCVGGLAIALSLGLSEFYLSVGIGTGLIAYSFALRRLLFIPTVAAAVLASSPLWAPLILWANGVDAGKWVLIAAIIVMLSAREILMDVRDRIGDLAGQRDTFATVFGDRISRFVGVLLLVGASVPFIFVLATKSIVLPVPKVIGLVLVGAAVLYLMIRPALQALMESPGERDEIQRFMAKSRLAMGLVPILILILW